MNPILIALLLLVLQAPAAGRLPLSGRVVKAGTEEPIGRASIVLAKADGRLEDYRTGTTDEAGRFSFTDLTPGTYRVFATRIGYLRAENRVGDSVVSATRSAGIVVKAGPPHKEVLLSMTPAGAIAGRIRNEDGLPMRHVWVRALRARYGDDGRRLDTAGFAETNDLGEYRIFDLPPGRYFVSAAGNRPRIDGEMYVAPAIPLQISAGDRGYRFETRTPAAVALSEGLVSAEAFEKGAFFPVYYPNTRNDAEAVPVELPAGVTLPGIDFVLVPMPIFHVRGRVIQGVSGQPLPTSYLSLTGGPSLPGFRSGPTGLFDIGGVPPGKYELRSWPDGLVTSQATARIEVADRDLEDITLILSPGFSLKGRLRIDGRVPVRSDAARFTVSVSSMLERSRVASGEVQADGSFTIANVGPGDYRVRVNGSNGPVGSLDSVGLYIKASRFGATDVLNSPLHVDQDIQGQQLEINVSPNLGVVEAVVRDENQRAAAFVPVVLVPDPSRRNSSSFYGYGVTDENGRVRFQDVAPGEYKAFTSLNDEFSAWMNPDLIRSRESLGEPVRVGEKDRKSVTLKVDLSRP